MHTDSGNRTVAQEQHRDQANNGKAQSVGDRGRDGVRPCQSSVHLPYQHRGQRQCEMQDNTAKLQIRISHPYRGGYHLTFKTLAALPYMYVINMSIFSTSIGYFAALVWLPFVHRSNCLVFISGLPREEQKSRNAPEKMYLM